MRADEGIHEAAMATRFHGEISDLVDLLQAYPTTKDEEGRV
jgi:hypothetical protein